MALDSETAAMDDPHSGAKVEVLNHCPLSNGLAKGFNERAGSVIYCTAGRGTGSHGPNSGINGLKLASILFLVSELNLKSNSGSFAIDKYRLYEHAGPFLREMDAMYEKLFDRGNLDNPVNVEYMNSL